MTTLISGATGFIGGWITRLLAERGETIRVLVRPDSPTDTLRGLPVQIVRGDLLDPLSLEYALSGVDHLYHAAGMISFNKRDEERLHLVNYLGTANILRAAMATGVKKIVHTASIFSLGYAPDADELATEQAAYKEPELTKIPYVYAKVRADQEAYEALQLGAPIVRLYPGLCLGPGDRNRSSSAQIDAWLKGKLPAIITGGGICLMDVRDAAAAHIAAMERGVVGEEYLAAGHNVTLVDLFERLEAITGKTAPRWQLEPELGLPLARIADRLNLLPGINTSLARLMTRLWWYDSTRAVEQLGITFRPLDDTLREAVEWLESADA